MNQDRLLINLAVLHARYPARMLLLVAVLTAIALVFASKLTMTPRWSDLLPEKDIRILIG